MATRGAPVRAGEIGCRILGCKIEAYDETGTPVVGERGELVITAPMPSMPVGFWGDATDPVTATRLRPLFRRMAAWRLDHLPLRRSVRDRWPVRCDAEPRRRVAGHVRVLPPWSTRSTAWRTRCSPPRGHRGRPGELLLLVAPAEGRQVDDGLRATIATAFRSELSPRPDVLNAYIDYASRRSTVR